MKANPTPREMAKGLLDGIVPYRPLFLPIVFSIGAKVENVPLEAFLSNPTKISSSLRQMRSHLRADGVACYFDPYLEVEALGATVERASDDQPPILHWPLPATKGELPQSLRSPEEVAKSGRVPRASEVIRRMNALPQRDFLLMAGVMGPLTLAARMLQLGHKERIRSEDLSATAQEFAATVVTQMASTFLEAGADVIFIREEMVPALSAESCDAWANQLAPAINVVRFYEALPVLQLAVDSSAVEKWDMMFKRQWDCVVCLPLGEIVSRRSGRVTPLAGTMLGIALPWAGLSDGEAKVQDLQQILPQVISEIRPALITTVGDVPATADLKRLVKVFEGIPRGE